MTHEGCACAEAVPESGECNHSCSAETGCEVTENHICVHTVCDETCGFKAAADCTFVCEECKTEEKTCTCGAAEEGEDEHAPFCDLYERTYEVCKCVQDCAQEGLNTYCETCYFEGVEACGASGEEEDVAFAANGTAGTLTWELDDNGTLTISGNGGMTSSTWLSDHSASIKKVVIKSGVTSIGASAFEKCVNLESVTIEGNITTIGSSAFSGCNNLNIYYYGTTSPSPSTRLSNGTTVYVPKDSSVTGFGRATTIQLEASSPPDDTTTYTIIATATPAEGGTASGGCNVNRGTKVTVTAAACDGYKFVNWTENGTVVSTANHRLALG